MTEAPVAVVGQRVESGPIRVRNERRWELSLPDGERAVLAQLLPEAAADESMRRRFVYEAERLSGIRAPRLAQVLAIGPQPDPRDPQALPPWRLRQAPEGMAFDVWLRARAPAPVDQVLAIVARLADAVHGVHEAGLVLRDLEPRSILLTADEEVWLADVGLARVDILSTHTASSLLLEGSPYAAPEHLRATVVDPRADVYTLGVILWEALTGVLPLGEGSTLARERPELPPLAKLCRAAPAGLDALLRQCLAASPDQRPASARVLASALRGGQAPAALSLVRVDCQACGAPMRPGLSLCLSCGKTTVQFQSIDPQRDDNWSVCLTKAREDAHFVAKIREHIEVLAEHTPSNLNFIVGDARMYSKAEREHGISLPVCLFRDLSRETAAQLVARMRADGLDVELRDTHRAKKRKKKARVGLAVGGAIGSVGLVAMLATPWFGLLAAAGLIVVIASAIQTSRRDTKPLLQLRRAPTALPASAALVRRLGAAMAGARRPDVHEQLAELALLVQRLHDHRAELRGDSFEAAMRDGDNVLVDEPLTALVELVVRRAASLGEIDDALASLHEHEMVRALAASEAREELRERRAPLLQGLDRLRELEDRRAVHMQQLLEAGSLLRNVVDLGLTVEDPQALGDRYLTMALAALGVDDAAEG